MSQYMGELDNISCFFNLQSPDMKFVASGALDGIINVFDVDTGKLVHTLEGHGKNAELNIIN